MQLAYHVLQEVIHQKLVLRQILIVFHAHQVLIRHNMVQTQFLHVKLVVQGIIVQQ